MQRRTFTAAAMVVGFGVGGLARAQEMVFFRIGSGAVGGTYFPIAGLLAGAVSNPPGSRACEDGGSCGVPGLVAIAQATHASAANVASVESGELQSGLASADIVHLAYNGVEPFAPHPKLRVIANLYPEHLQLVLKKGLPIETLADLAGRRVGIGQPGSGTQVAVRELLAMNDVAEFEPVELDNTASAESLASGELDAYFQVAGAPTPATVQLAAATGIDLYRFSGDEIAAFVEALPYFYESTIPERTYPG
ncbi:MAG: TAXI family TRAP transporter solute-binding subunit, partial [Pseudomonadota bacterium]